MAETIKKLVLAYSGGLDTSVMLTWVIETYGCEVITFTADIGQGEELDGLDIKARKTGASSVFIEDLREEFAEHYVFPALRANAVYEGTYLLGTALARPLIGRRMAEIARLEGADAVAHGATGKGNDQVRFELTCYALSPDIKIVAPWRTWEFRSRQDLLDYAERKQIPVSSSRHKPYSMDANLLHVSYEGGILEDPWCSPPDEIFRLTVSPENAPDKSEELEIEFEAGTPVAVNGERMSPALLLQTLNQIGGRHGVGRDDIVENRFVGMKSRGVYETPGGTILHKAHRALESITMDREAMYLRDSMIPYYAKLVYNGFWFTPEREMLQTMIDESQKGVTGTVRVKLYKGHVSIRGRKAPKSLYRMDFATFDGDDVYNQYDAEGFIKLNALRLRIRAMAGR
ncbi:MAG: argininosuccinate synthase [Myxococcales bacterium]|nr:argininosuccinate synthase [Myxococcales bacterium]